MCGIVGFVGSGNSQDLTKMIEAAYHRGPDGSGRFEDPDNRIYLGHRRLAIVDVEGGHQPMWSADRKIGVIFNGEIYNQYDLRRELESKGHVFQSSHSDTEVLVYGYREWGTDLSLKLNGMFAFAIYDLHQRTLFLSRDRFGEKPLYYARHKDLFAFASEIHGICVHGHFERQIDINALQKFFAHGYLPAPAAIYRDTKMLPAGHSLVFNISDGSLREYSYWTFQLEPDESLKDADEGRLCEELRSLVIQSVERRLMSDIPIGVFLSGGLDSSIVLATLAMLRPPEEIDTFCVGFDDPSFDETNYARETAAYFEVNYHERQVTMHETLARLPDILGTLDEPFGDPSYLPTYILCEFARKQVTVALTGDGADEMFAGYDPFLALAPANLYQRLVPGPAHKMLRWSANFLPKSDRNMSLDFKIDRALMGLSHPPEFWNPVWLSPLRPEDGEHLFSKPYELESVYSDALARWRRDDKLDLVDRTLEFYVDSYLHNGILTKIDRASMSVSLESRAVFLDYDLVEFCRTLPNSFKLRHGQRKYLLRKAFADILPKKTLARPKKGFGIPLKNWMRNVEIEGDLPELTGIDEVWLSERQEQHRLGQADHRHLIWCWLNLRHMKR